MDEIQYYEMQEQNAVGEIMVACAKKIFDQYDAETMAQLQRTLYKHTEAGIAISFELHEGACEYADDSTEAHIGNCEPSRKSPFVYCGDKRAGTITEPWLSIRAIGVSSIVEGSDAEVPVTWIDLIRYCDENKYEGDLADLAIQAFNDFDALCAQVNDEACALWEECHDEQGNEI